MMEKLGYGLMILTALALAGLLSAMPALTPKHTVNDGTHNAHVIRSNARVSVSGGSPKQQWLVKLDDNREFWINVPASAVGHKGRELAVDVRCLSEERQRCTASVSQSNNQPAN